MTNETNGSAPGRGSPPRPDADSDRHRIELERLARQLREQNAEFERGTRLLREHSDVQLAVDRNLLEELNASSEVVERVPEGARVGVRC